MSVAERPRTYKLSGSPERRHALPALFFMTGEYCSQLSNINKVKERLHKCPEENTTDIRMAGEINAFVIMNFSNMSNVAYRWRLQPFIESSTKYFYFEEMSWSAMQNHKSLMKTNLFIEFPRLMSSVPTLIILSATGSASKSKL